MAFLILKENCANCNGTGTFTPASPQPATTCIHCGGDGLLDVGTMDVTDLMDKLDDIMDKCNDIKEVVDGL